MNLRKLFVAVALLLAATTIQNITAQTIKDGVLTIKKGTAEIKSREYYGNTNIKKVSIPSSVTKIGELAFGNCSNLTEIEIPSSVKTIEKSAFQNSKIEMIDLNNNLTEIGKNAFPDKTIVRVKRNTFADKWAKSNGYYLCGVLADLNYYTKDRTKQITEDFTRILCDDDTYLNWTSYQFKVQEPLKIEDVGGEIVLTSFLLEPCVNVTVTKSGKTILSKKTIQPLTRTVLCKAEDAAKPEDFKVTSDDGLYRKLTSLGNVLDWTVTFNGDYLRKTESGNKGVPYLKMLPVFCREWIATICNHAYVIASKEYEDYCLDCVEKKWLVTDEWQTKFLSTSDMRKLLQKARKHTFKLGRCDGGGLGAVGGEGLFLLDGWFRNVGYNGGAFYHEFSHNMGYNHEDGNMCNQEVGNGYGEKSWQLMGKKIFKQLFEADKLPYTDVKLFNSDLFSYDELNAPDPPENIIKNGVLYVAEGVTAIANAEYANNRLISKVVFSSSVEVILSNAFFQSYISEIDIPSTVKKIGSGAFESTALTTTVVIPDGVKEIGTGAFFSTRIPKIVVPASVTKFGEMITDKKVVWVVERGTPAYEYAVKNNYQIEVPGETPEEAAASIVNEKAEPGPKNTWKSGDFPMNDVRMYWDFSEFLDGEGRYVVSFTTTSGSNRLWLTDAIFIADGKLLEQFPETKATRSIDYIIYVPAGTKKLEFYALAHTNRGTNSNGTIVVEKW